MSMIALVTCKITRIHLQMQDALNARATVSFRGFKKLGLDQVLALEIRLGLALIGECEYGWLYTAFGASFDGARDQID